MENKPILFRCSQLGKLMTEPRSKSETLSETTKTYLTEVYIQLKYGRTKEITSKYFEKGIICEEDSITLLSRVTKTMFLKNEVNLKNDYITGTPDIFKGESIQKAEFVPDIKTSWDIFTFFEHKQKGLSKDNYWQDLGYLWLTGAQKGGIAHCLVDTPEMLIDKEKSSFLYKNPGLSQEQIDEAFSEIQHNSTYGDIPISERVCFFGIERLDSDIERLKTRIEECRNYINQNFKF